MKRAAVALLIVTALAALIAPARANDDLKWHESWKHAKDAAAESGKPILVMLYLADHDASERVEKSLGATELRELLAQLELVKIEREESADQIEALEAATGATVKDVPELWIVTAKGKPVERIGGVKSPKALAGLLKAAIEKAQPKEDG